MPVKLKEEELVKEQMKVIDKLQDEIRLLRFDISKNLETITQFKDALRRKNITVAKAREELVMMKKENNYNNINHVLSVLRGVVDEG